MFNTFVDHIQICDRSGDIEWNNNFKIGIDR